MEQPPVVSSQGYVQVQAPVYAQQAPPPGYQEGRRTLPYREGDPIPLGYSPREKARIGLIIAGSATLGIMYLLSLMTYMLDDSLGCIGTDGGGSGCRSDLWPLAIPAAGPFLAIGTSGAEGGGLTLLLLDGMAQLGGVTMLVLGIVAKKTVLVRNDIAGVHVAPLAFDGGGHGFALAGHF
jgi:hypothetical protein